MNTSEPINNASPDKPTGDLGSRGYRFKDFENTWKHYLPPSPCRSRATFPSQSSDATCNVAATAFFTNAVADVSLNSH